MHVILVALIAALLGTSQVQPTANLQLVKEFRKHNLGLFDMSTDGALLLFHEAGRRRGQTTTFRMRAIRTRDYVEVASVKVGLPDAGGYGLSNQRYFLPGTHKVVLVGIPEKSGAATGIFMWTPETGAIEQVPDLLSEHVFLAGAWDSDQLLCYSVESLNAPPSSRKGRKFFLYRLSTRESKPIDFKDDEFRFDADSSIVRSPDGEKVVARPEATSNMFEIRALSRLSARRILVPPDREIVNYRFSPDGRYVVVLSLVRVVVPGTAGGTRGLSEQPSISVYDSDTGARLLDQQILNHIVPLSRRVFTLPAAENYLVSTGEEMSFSPDGQFLAISFCVGNRNNGHQSARFALYRFPTLQVVGFAQHPDVKIGVFEFIGQSAVGGRLRFSTDSRLLYTTSKFTAAWMLPR